MWVITQCALRVALARLFVARKASIQLSVEFLGSQRFRSAARAPHRVTAAMVQPEPHSLRLAGQEHLISHWDELDSHKQVQLMNELKVEVAGHCSGVFARCSLLLMLLSWLELAGV